tara:strand:+ start:423 stop:614 length:192 start_codon:yes stop_codon:yes gene_type:complete
MFAILLISMAFNIVLVGVIYSFMAENIPESEQIIMQLHARINELELELSGVHTDVYLDEIISE